MSKEIVKYNNNLNYIGFNGFTETELNIFFAICAKLKDKGTTDVSFTFKQLRDLTREKQHYTKEGYAKLVSGMYHKLIHLVYYYNKQDSFGEFNVFEGFECNISDEVFTITMTQKFAYMFNELTEHFTMFELQEYVETRGIYTKHLYQLLKQFRSTGKCIFMLEDFRRRMDVPEGYKMRDITKRIVNPSVEKLRTLEGFKDLSYEYETRNRKVYKITFTWNKKNAAEQTDDGAGIDTFHEEPIDAYVTESSVQKTEDEEVYDPSKGNVWDFIRSVQQKNAAAESKQEETVHEFDPDKESISDFLDHVKYEDVDKAEDRNSSDSVAEDISYTQKLAMFVSNAKSDLEEQEQNDEILRDEDLPF